MTDAISERVRKIQTPVIPVVGQWIREHPGTISLGQGVVHYAPPESVALAIQSSVKGEESVLNGYGYVGGTDELLTGIARKLQSENGINLNDERAVFVTAGSNMGFVNALIAIADVGDEVILLSPYYFNHEMAVSMLGCHAKIVATDDDYQISVDRVAAAMTPKTKAVVTISPANPTGAVAPKATITEINRLCREQEVFHISDEAYEYFIWGDEKHFSPASLPDSVNHTIGLYSFSKAYGMAGWRTGYMVIPKSLEMAVRKIQDTNLVCPPIVSQVAAAAALQAGRDWCAPQIESLRGVRQVVLEQLEALGDAVQVPTPDGAFYVLVKLDTKRQDMEIVEALIRDFGVAVLPGSTFGVHDRCAIRIAYGALHQDRVAEGMDRLTKGLRAVLT